MIFGFSDIYYNWATQFRLGISDSSHLLEEQYIINMNNEFGSCWSCFTKECHQPDYSMAHLGQLLNSHTDDGW